MEAVVGVYGSGYVSRMVFLALHGMQQRVARTTGIATFHNGEIFRDVGIGITRNYFDDSKLDILPGNVGIGHIGESDVYGSDPLYFQPRHVFFRGNHVVLAQDGRVADYSKLRDLYARDGAIFNTDAHSELMMHNFALASRTGSSSKRDLTDALMDTFEPVKNGAYAVVMMVDGSLIGARDVHGLRPLVFGRIDGGYILSSEDGFFDNVSAQRLRDVEPGEILTVSDKGIESIYLSKAGKQHCVRELLYFSMPDSTVEGLPVTVVRHALGRMLYGADINPPRADIVISVPDSGNDYASGYSDISGIPLRSGLIRHHFGGPSFISSFGGRDGAIRKKLRPNSHVVNDKSVVVVDDSILEGIVMWEVTDMLRGAGAREIHWRVASPMLKAVCPYGLRTLESSERFIANKTSDILSYTGADSLFCLSQGDLDGTIEAVARDLDVDLTRSDFCKSCITGRYSVE